MSSVADHEQDVPKRTATNNIKGLWRDAFRALKTSTTSSGTADEENRSVSGRPTDFLPLDLTELDEHAAERTFA